MKGENLRAARERLGLSGKDLAKLVGTTGATVSRWEHGITKPRDEFKEKLARVLNVSIGYLMGDWEVGGDSVSGPHDGWILKIPVVPASSLMQRASSRSAGKISGTGEVLTVAMEDLGLVSFEPGKEPFGIVMEGSGMEEANIPPGARVIINPSETVHTGEAALVCFGGEKRECTVKWVYQDSCGGMEIRSASLLYPPRKFSAEEVEDGAIQIIGRVMGSFIKPIKGA